VTSRTVRLARRALAAVLTLAAMSGVSACKYGAALSKREVVVIFKPGATQDQHRLVLASCGSIPHALPEAMGQGTLVSELASNVRYRVDKASDADMQKLVSCFQQFSFVQSYDIPDLSH
jgi:hypothetical protein